MRAVHISDQLGMIGVNQDGCSAIHTLRDRLRPVRNTEEVAVLD
jgi:hypothetical protein